MDQLVQHLSEQHQFYLSILDKLVSLATIVCLGVSQPPVHLLKKPGEQPK